MYSAVISTIGLDQLLLLQPMLLMIGAKTPAGSDDWDRLDHSVLSAARGARGVTQHAEARGASVDGGCRSNGAGAVDRDMDAGAGDIDTEHGERRHRCCGEGQVRRCSVLVLPQFG
jgi:hypothetical protein